MRSRFVYAGLAAVAVSLPAAAFARAGGVETVGGPTAPPPPSAAPCANTEAISAQSGAIMRSGLVNFSFTITNCSSVTETVYPTFTDFGYVRADATRTPCYGGSSDLWNFAQPAGITLAPGKSVSLKELAPYNCSPQQEVGVVRMELLTAAAADGGVLMGGQSVGNFYWTTPTKP